MQTESQNDSTFAKLHKGYSEMETRYESFFELLLICVWNNNFSVSIDCYSAASAGGAAGDYSHLREAAV